MEWFSDFASFLKSILNNEILLLYLYTFDMIILGIAILAFPIYFIYVDLCCLPSYPFNCSCGLYDPFKYLYVTNSTFDP